MLKVRAFSLIELMVVIAIVAILAAVAAPTYKTYTTKTRINTILDFSRKLSNQIFNVYETTGNWPTSMSWGGYTFSTAYPNTAFATPSLNSLGIATLRVEVYTPSNQVRVLITTIGLTAIPSYVGDTGAAGSAANTYNTLSIIGSELNNSIVFKCGTGIVGDSYYVPINFQPSACTCTTLNSYFGTPSYSC